MEPVGQFWPTRTFKIVCRGLINNQDEKSIYVAMEKISLMLVIFWPTKTFCPDFGSLSVFEISLGPPALFYFYSVFLLKIHQKV